MAIVAFCLTAVDAFAPVTLGGRATLSGKATFNAPAAPETFVDTFNRVDANPMSTTASDGNTWTSGPGALTDCKIAFNSLSGTGTLENGARVLTPTFAANHSASVTLGGSGAEVLQTGPCVRMQSASDSSCYRAYAVTLTLVRVFKAVDTGTIAETQLGADFTVTSLVPGDVITLAASGSILTLYVNAVSQGTRSDSTFGGGQPAIFTLDANHYAESFSATDL